ALAVMATGTGKTLVAVNAAFELRSASTLLLFPSITLVNQTLAYWRAHSRWFTARGSQPQVLVVCSDSTVGRDSEQRSVDAHAREELAASGVRVTTDAVVVAEFLERPGRKLVFGTYHSADVVAKAQTPRTWFDLLICDEA